MKEITAEIQVLASKEQREGRRTVINRLIPSINNNAFNPIILFEEYFIEPPMEFVTKENKNIEVINYLFDGGIDHKNEIENKYTTILQGEILRYTAGKGFVHAERPVNRGANHGIKIGFSLTHEDSPIEPSFQICHQKDFHQEENKSSYIRTLAGKKSPLKLNVKAEIKDVLLYENSQTEFEIPEGYNGLIYVISGLNGDLFTSNSKIKPSQSLFFKNIDKIKVESRSIAVRFLFICTKPLNENPYDLSETNIN